MIKLMINSASLSTRIINLCFITVLLLVSSVASSQVNVSNTVSVVCAQTGAKTMLPSMNNDELADCCQLEGSKTCCNTCHAAAYQTVEALQLSLMELSDENVGVTSTWLRSLNPPPLIRPPVIV